MVFERIMQLMNKLFILPGVGNKDILLVPETGINLAQVNSIASQDFVGLSLVILIGLVEALNQWLNLDQSWA